MLVCHVCKSEIEKYWNGYKCRDCYNSYMRAYNLERYHRLRAERVESMGGACIDCGSRDRLEFDHVDRSQKLLDIGTKWANPESLDELKKCVLRCKECHKAKTSRELSVEHGGGASGKSRCPCNPCRLKRNEYARNWKRNRRNPA